MTVVLDNDRLDYPTRVRVRELSHPCTGQGIIPPVYGSGNKPATRVYVLRTTAVTKDSVRIRKYILAFLATESMDKDRLTICQARSKYSLYARSAASFPL